MKLTDIFAGRTKNEDIGRLQKPAAPVSPNMAAVNRQIRSMVPGQTIQGEIVSRNGGEVQIRTADDLLLNARVDQSMNMEVGSSMTFEVKSNGSALTLTPLFANLSTDINVLKALDMAGISVNQTSVAMTEQMMEAGLPIDRNSVQQLYREVNAFPNAEISDIVSLHKLGLPVNEENINQMASYRNLNHQLLQGMETVLDALPNVVEELVTERNMAGAVRLYQELLHMVQENASAGGAPAENIPGEDIPGGNTLAGEILREAVEGAAEGGIPGSSGTQEEAAVQAGRGPEAAKAQQALEAAVKLAADADGMELAGKGTQIQKDGGAQPGEIPLEVRAAVSRELGQVLSRLGLTPQEGAQLAGQIEQFAKGASDAGELFHTLGQMLERARGAGAEGREALQLLASQKGVRTLLADTLKNSWTLRPQEVAEPDKVEEMYRRLDRQLRGLTQTLETVGQSGSEAYKAASNLSQNIDFLQQLNQMYTYVQLPLRLQQGNAHGDLYVYTNKKNLAGRDGSVSALLHLDMEQLGPVDVYVAMQNNRVSTKFYVVDDEMLDFLEAHMDILTDRLQKRGYDCSLSMEVRGEGENVSSRGGLEPILGREKGVALAQYAFDVRT